MTRNSGSPGDAGASRMVVRNVYSKVSAVSGEPDTRADSKPESSRQICSKCQYLW